MSDIKEMVKDNRKVTFLCYKDNEFWYKTENGFEFPVPISDTAGAIFLPEDKALVFMRWIRKHAKYLEDSKQDQNK